MKVFSKQTGETIIEVMLSVVLLGFTMTTIYAIARRSLDTGQAASERTQVLAMIETQIERMKVLAELREEDRLANPGQDIFESATPFCLDDQLMKRDPSDAACYNSTFPIDAGLRIAIVYNQEGPTASPHDNDTFEISSNWDRVNDADTTEELNTAYRLHQSLPSAQPQVSCGDSPTLNITEYLLNNVNASRTSFDAYYVPPQYQNNGSLDLASNEKPFSEPDFPISESLNLFVHEACEYGVSYTMWCSAPDRNTYAQNRNCGSDQPNEVLRIRFWDTYVPSTNGAGNDTSYCDGSVLAYIDTNDSPFIAGQPSIPDWGDTEIVSASSSNRILDNGLARCMDVIHICELPQADFLALNGAYNCSDWFWERPDGTIEQGPYTSGSRFVRTTHSSVHLHDVDWTVQNN